MEIKTKRKRSHNFTNDEKLKFIRLIEKEGYAILMKTTSHDYNTNRLKDKAWQKITACFNASGISVRYVYYMYSSIILLK